MQVREEAEKAFGPGDSAPSRAAADAMTYTVCALQVRSSALPCHGPGSVLRDISSNKPGANASPLSRPCGLPKTHPAGWAKVPWQPAAYQDTDPRPSPALRFSTKLSVRLSGIHGRAGVPAEVLGGAGGDAALRRGRRDLRPPHSRRHLPRLLHPGACLGFAWVGIPKQPGVYLVAAP